MSSWIVWIFFKADLKIGSQLQWLTLKSFMWRYFSQFMPSVVLQEFTNHNLCKISHETLAMIFGTFIFIWHGTLSVAYPINWPHFLKQILKPNLMKIQDAVFFCHRMRFSTQSVFDFVVRMMTRFDRGVLAGCRTWWCARRDPCYSDGGKRRELLCRAEKRICGNEEPGGKVQRPAFCGQEWTRWGEELNLLHIFSLWQ